MVAVICRFLVVFIAAYGIDIVLSIKYSHDIISVLSYRISYIHHIIIFKVFQMFLSFAMLIALFLSYLHFEWSFSGPITLYSKKYRKT